jgi:hypothetical protein
MFELEETDEQKAKLLAKVFMYLNKDIGAVFKYTSAKNASGIDVY